MQRPPIDRPKHRPDAIRSNESTSDPSAVDESAPDSLMTPDERRQLRLFHTTLSTIADFAYTFDRDGRFLYSNRPLLDLLGIELDQIVGRNFFDLGYPHDLAARLQRQIEHVFVTTEEVVDETSFVDPSGNQGFFEYIFRPVVSADGAVEMVVGSTRDVTQRKRLEGQSRQILESITDAFFALDSAWRFTFLNERAEEVLGRSHGDLIGHTLWDAYPGTVGSQFERAYRRTAADRVSTSFTEFFPDHGRWYEVRAYPAEPGITVYFQDVTERRHDEETLRRDAHRAAFRIELADALRPLADPEIIQREAARVIGGALGSTRAFYAESDSASGDFVVHEDFHDGVPSVAGRYRLDDFGAEVALALRAGRTVVVADVAEQLGSTQAHAAAYAAIDVRAHATVCLVKDGRLVALLGVHQDMPRVWTRDEIDQVEETAERTWAAVERARAELALRRSEEQYRSLFEVMDIGFCVIEVAFDHEHHPTDYRFLQMNPAFERHTGLRDAIGRTARDMVPDLEPFWFEMYGHVAATGEAVQFTNTSTAMNQRWFDVYAYRFGAAERNHVAILFADVSERKRLERQKDEFLAIASHELKTPVSSVKAFSQVLGRRFQRAGDIESAGLMGKMNSQLNKLNDLIGDLLDVTMIESGQIRFRPQPFDLDQLVAEIADQVQLIASDRRLHIDGRAGLSIVADRDRTGQALTNLLTNAVKFSPPGSEIVLAVATDVLGATVTVTDRGIGISAERQALVFDRFYRVSDPQADTNPGLGLGLFIAAEIVRRQGGRIWVESVGRQGSTFGFWLPRSSGDVESATPGSEIARAGAGLI